MDLFTAIQTYKIDTIRCMLEKGADVNVLYDKWSPLHFAVYTGSLPIVQLLLNYGADVSAGIGGTTPLHVACQLNERHYDLCKLLCEIGADCNFKNDKGVSPFLTALQFQNLEVVKLLLDHGADITTEDQLGLTAINYAAGNPHVDVLEFVLDQGFPIEPSNGKGRSPLINAAIFNNFEGCEILLKRGANINTDSSYGILTPLIAAIMGRGEHDQNTKIVQLLLEYGAEVTVQVLIVALMKEKANATEIRNALVRQVAKLDFLNLSLTQYHGGLIDQEQCYKRYYRTCLRELKYMKATMIHDEVSVLNILTGNTKTLSKYAMNKELLKALKRKAYNFRFPIYFASLKKRFYAAVEKRQLWKHAEIILGNLFRLNDPLHLVNQNILFYLTDADLKIISTPF